MDGPSEEDWKVVKSEEGQPPLTREEEIDQEVVDSEAGEPEEADDRGK